jgi:very-short-patch-repair endonuclease
VEKVVVEVDGDEHRSRLKWADDRQRDNLLHLAGYVVLRFPNDRVAMDMAAVLNEIHMQLDLRRSP